MALKNFNPTTSSQRQLVIVDRSQLYRGKPVKSLTQGLTKKGGRNNAGRITARYQGGGHKRSYRFVDFRRLKRDVVVTGAIATKPFKSFVRAPIVSSSNLIHTASGNSPASNWSFRSAGHLNCSTTPIAPLTNPSEMEILRLSITRDPLASFIVCRSPPQLFTSAGITLLGGFFRTSQAHEIHRLHL